VVKQPSTSLGFILSSPDAKIHRNSRTGLTQAPRLAGGYFAAVSAGKARRYRHPAAGGQPIGFVGQPANPVEALAQHGFTPGSSGRGDLPEPDRPTGQPARSTGRGENRSGAAPVQDKASISAAADEAELRQARSSEAAILAFTLCLPARDVFFVVEQLEVVTEKSVDFAD
jgi:hypothetical protein